MCKIPILQNTRQIEYSKVEPCLHLNADDSVVVGGTLVEGIGNSHSDLDIYVIAQERPKYGAITPHNHAFVHRRDMKMCVDPDEELFMTMDYYPDSAMHVDVEYWLYSELVAIGNKIRESFESAQTHSDMCYEEFAFSRVEKLLIHRLLTGCRVKGEQGVIDEAILATEKHYSYLLYRTVANNYWCFKDIVGAYLDDNGLMIMASCRRLLISELQGAIFLRGITNATEKWLTTYLQKCTDLVDSGLTERAIQLMYNVPNNSYIEYLNQSLAFITDLEQSNRRILDSDPEIYVSSAQAIEMISQERIDRQSSAGKPQEHEFKFREKTYTDNNERYMDLMYDCTS